jgi:hypothetical protein
LTSPVSDRHVRFSGSMFGVEESLRWVASPRLKSASLSP